MSVPPAKGFSLVELLVVIGLIVVVMGLALPAFNFISGTRSVDGAANVVSAFLGRARAEALAAQRPTGVFFYIDPATERRAMALVQATDSRAFDTNRGDFDVWLDLLDAEPILLPAGIDVQLINDGTRPGTTARTDGYLGFNDRGFSYPETAGAPSAATGLAIRYGGVILFDGQGRLVTQKYAFRGVSGSTLTTLQATRMGALLYQGVQFDPTDTTNTTARDFAPVRADGAANHAPLRSGLGLTMVELDRFRTVSNDGDPQVTAPAVATAFSTSAAEVAEEAWLDENATPMLINRYTGTLVKGQ